MRRGEVPVGAAVVRGNRLLCVGRNNRQARKSMLGHAEIVALTRATRILGDWRLDGVTVYVTLEPCPMCVGAMLSSRVSRLVYGTCDPLAGAAGSVLNLADYPGLPHHMEVLGNVCGEEAAALLKEFFATRRKSES